MTQDDVYNFFMRPWGSMGLDWSVPPDVIDGSQAPIGDQEPLPAVVRVNLEGIVGAPESEDFKSYVSIVNPNNFDDNYYAAVPADLSVPDDATNWPWTPDEDGA